MVLPISRFWYKFSLFLACLLVFWAGFYPEWVEKYYAQAFYPHWSRTLRFLLGNIPFSLGDLVYGLALLLLFWAIWRMGRDLLRMGFRSASWLWLGKILHALVWVYLLFSLCWGLLYVRPSLGTRWQLKPVAYQKEDIRRLTLSLLDSTRKYRQKLGTEAVWRPCRDSLVPWTLSAYAPLALAQRTPALDQTSLKPSLFGALGDWVGYTGYFNPFTGEGQYRADLPFVLQPFVSLHETAHQLGYAPEDEASWVAYTAALNHPSDRVRYSAHLELLGYALAEEFLLYGQEGSFAAFDSIAKENKARMDPGVRADRKRIRDFFLSRQNQVSPAMNALYDQYLKLNRQEKGLRSYHAVLSWALAHQN